MVILCLMVFRRVLESDLEQAESKLRGAFESLMNEKELR